MNSQHKNSVNPIHLLKSLKNNRNLIFELAKRDIAGRYRGTALGGFWSFITPLVMLAVYTFVFSVIFQARWNIEAKSKFDFALILYSGLIIFGIFSESLTRASSAIVGNANYVKKVVFPLEILPIVQLISTLFHFFINLLVWLAFHLAVFGLPHMTILLLPIVMIPLIAVSIGSAWLISSLSVYLRDLGQLASLMSVILTFMSPIFFPVEAIPADFRTVVYLNPLTYIVEEARNVMLWGNGIDIGKWTIYTVASLIFSWLSFCVFQKTRSGFSDVL